MICPFCGKENEKSSEKCQFCGYEFYAIKRTSREIQPEQLTTAPTPDFIEESENIPQNSNTAESSTYNDSSIISSQIEADEPEVVEDTNSTSENIYRRDYTRENIVEIIASLISIAVAVVSLYKWSINRAPYDTTLDINIMVLLGAIGLVDTIICTLLEGVPPCTVSGTLIRTVVLIFILEMHSFIAVPIFLVVFGISACYVVFTYSHRKPAILLGIVSVILFPFLGYIIAVIGSLFMKGLSSSRKRKK